jgi:hypothetical protein
VAVALAIHVVSNPPESPATSLWIPGLQVIVRIHSRERAGSLDCRSQIALPSLTSPGAGFTLMMNITNYPLLVFVLSFAVMWLSARVGASFRQQHRSMGQEERQDFGLIVGATLTLLGLIIGFSFSMAINRYDQRKNYEEAEANAIGTEYLRADLLPAGDGARVRAVLKNYLDQRIVFYNTREAGKLRQLAASTAQLQVEMWSAVQGSTALPTTLYALAITGMNDVLNSQGYTQAAWWNRIPIAAWSLMAAIAICCNLLIGYGAHREETRSILFLVLPLLVAIRFFSSLILTVRAGGSFAWAGKIWRAWPSPCAR